MTTGILFRKIDRLYLRLVRNLQDIADRHADSRLDISEASLMEIDIAVLRLRDWVTVHNFTSLAEEVIFFRELKPPFIALFIYHVRLLALEAGKPGAGHGELQKYYASELLDLRHFSDANRDFYSYFRRQATYMDHIWFVRRHFDIKAPLDTTRYDRDENFTSSHDHKVALILAGDMLEKYILTALQDSETHYMQKFTEKSALTWTASKTALVELIYGLHLLHCFNGGTADLSETVRVFARTFNMDLGNFHKSLHDIGNRKIDRTKFLTSLQQKLLSHFESTDA